MAKADDVRFADFERVVLFTGAGMSAESGVPTYRGAGGLWAEYDYERYACQAAFDEDPARVWEFHDLRRAMVGRCEPNDGHRLIARLEAERPGVSVVTQNIDGLHQRAGSRRVLELHGSLWRVRCDRCGAVEERLEVALASHRHECGAWLRPDIVWFGDALRGDVIDAAVAAIERCDLLVAVGTSGVVFPAAHLPLAAKKAGARLVEINPEATPLSTAHDVCLRGPASAMLARLL